MYGSDGSTAFGLARIEPDGSWTRLSLDLSSWPGRRAISRIKVAVRGSGDADWHGTFDIDQVSASAATAPATNLRSIAVSAAASGRKGVGSTVTLGVTDNDTRPLTGELTVVPCDGVTTSPADLALGRIAPAGGTGTLSTTITGYDPQDRAHPRICVEYRDQQLAAPIVLPPPTETVLYGFESGVQGWAPGQNVASVSTVTGMANGPGTPHGGSCALDAAATSGDASALKTVEVSTGGAAWMRRAATARGRAAPRSGGCECSRPLLGECVVDDVAISRVTRNRAARSLAVSARPGPAGGVNREATVVSRSAARAKPRPARRIRRTRRWRTEVSAVA